MALKAHFTVNLPFSWIGSSLASEKIALLLNTVLIAQPSLLDSKSPLNRREALADLARLARSLTSVIWLPLLRWTREKLRVFRWTRVVSSVFSSSYVSIWSRYLNIFSSVSSIETTSSATSKHRPETNLPWAASREFRHFHRITSPFSPCLSMTSMFSFEIS